MNSKFKFFVIATVIATFITFQARAEHQLSFESNLMCAMVDGRTFYKNENSVSKIRVARDNGSGDWIEAVEIRADFQSDAAHERLLQGQYLSTVTGKASDGKNTIINSYFDYGNGNRDSSVVIINNKSKSVVVELNVKRTASPIKKVYFYSDAGRCKNP